MRELKFVLHHDCPFCKGTRKHHGVAIKELSFGVIGRRRQALLLHGMYELTASDNGELESCLRYIKEEPSFHVTPLLASRGKCLFATRWQNDLSPCDAIHGHGGLCTEPVVIENGIEQFRVLMEDGEEIRPLMEDITRMGDSKVLRIGRFSTTPAKSGLTRKQLETFNLAVKNGYYEWPKKVNLDELASISGISRTTLQNHLRKAEAKIMPRTHGTGYPKATCF